MQLVYIKWDTAVSQYFRISNGVRQGVVYRFPNYLHYIGIDCPVLFHIVKLSVILMNNV